MFEEVSIVYYNRIRETGTCYLVDVPTYLYVGYGTVTIRA